MVVFRGVTAGFLLNNWRTADQERQIEQQYINGFLSDIKGDIEELENAIDDDSIFLKRTHPILLMIRDKKMNSDTASSMVRQIMTMSKLEENSGTYEDIRNSGNLNIISDFELRSRIVAYNMRIKAVDLLEDFFYQYFTNLVVPFMFEEYNMLTGEFNNPAVIQTTKFSNVFSWYYSMVSQRKEAYSELLVKARSLKLLLIEKKED